MERCIEEEHSIFLLTIGSLICDDMVAPSRFLEGIISFWLDIPVWFWSLYDLEVGGHAFS